MKIVHLVNELVAANGIVNVTVDLACGQAAAGHEVTVVSCGGYHEALLAQFGVRHHRLALDDRASLPRVVPALRLLLRDARPDVVHAHTMTGAVLAWALRGRRTRYRLVTTVHNEYQRSAILMGLGDRVVAVSEAVCRAMIARHVPARRLCVVLNGTIGSPRDAHVRHPAKMLAHPAIVTVGAVTERKGIDVLVCAFDQVAAAFPTAALYVVGNRDWPEVETLAASLPSGKRIHFTGRSDAPGEYLSDADVFVLASRREPLGLVIIEAREAGVPVIASAVDGLPEALDDGAAGILVPPADTSALADALRTLLSDDAVRAKWAYAASSGLERWTVARMLAEYEQVYLSA